jgi:predicted transcriptional regulator
VDKHCGRLRYDFNRRLQEIARDYRQTWLAKVDDTTQAIRQALERALSQKQSSAQTATVRAGELDQRLQEILQAETQLLTFKEKVESTLR